MIEEKGKTMAQNFTNSYLHKPESTSKNGMVASKNKLATEAGLQLLKLGGNAMDAAVATCFAIGVVEPESSGIGGGGYMVFQMAEEGGVYGFPMKGPLNATANMYDLTGESSVGAFGWAGVKNDENIHGYKSIAVPGCVSGLLNAHKKYGKLPLAEILSPAIELASKGFQPEWYSLFVLGGLTSQILRYSELKRVFMPDNSLPYATVSEGIFKQPDLANTLIEIKNQGVNGFYKSDITEAMVKNINDHGGILSMKDFEQYTPFLWKNGLEFSYRGKTIRVPPFASAGITTAMTLKILDQVDIASMGHNSTNMLHNYIMAARMAYADRFEYIADPEFTDVPWNGLISEDYSIKRFSEFTNIAPKTYSAGNPWIQEGRSPKFSLENSAPSPDKGTTHLAVIDGDGNAVSITNTIMSGFGSGIIPKNTGVIMNNGMMWYDPIPGRVNSISPGKYPLNNMTPAIVIGDSGVEIAVGASGGRRITNCVSSLLIKMIDFNMGPQDAIDAPRIDCSSEFNDITDLIPMQVINELKEKGHQIKVLENSYLKSGAKMFASPVAVTKANGLMKGGVDSFHSAYAKGL
jgi:gamma-glutamyltranspeptidase/glutathione hydrolase